jgi:hypothetical protein
MRDGLEGTAQAHSWCGTAVLVRLIVTGCTQRRSGFIARLKVDVDSCRNTYAYQQAILRAKFNRLL